MQRGDGSNPAAAPLSGADGSKNIPVVKCVVVGESGVGKTAIIERFAENRFSMEFKATIGAEFFAKVVTLPSSQKKVQVQLWDTAGQERYRSLSVAYFRGCEAALVVVDVTSEETFARTSYWVEEVLRGVGRTTIDGFPLFLVANKIDVDPTQWRVGKDHLETFARERGLSCLMCSAKTGENVEFTFQTCCAMAMDYRESMGLVEPMDECQFQPVTMSTPSGRTATLRRDRVGCCA